MKTDYSNIGAVCRDCAKSAGFTPKNKAVGMWMDECEICHERKLCTHLWNDWNPPKKIDHFADVGKKVNKTKGANK